MSKSYKKVILKQEVFKNLLSFEKKIILELEKNKLDNVFKKVLVLTGKNKLHLYNKCIEYINI